VGQVGTHGKNGLLDELRELTELLGDEEEDLLLLPLDSGVALDRLELLADDRLEEEERLELLTEERLDPDDEVLLDDEGAVAELRLLCEEDDERLLLAELPEE
jgi:hypothetical protein